MKLNNDNEWEYSWRDIHPALYRFLKFLPGMATTATILVCDCISGDKEHLAFAIVLAIVFGLLAEGASAFVMYCFEAFFCANYSNPKYAQCEPLWLWQLAKTSKQKGNAKMLEKALSDSQWPEAERLYGKV